MFIECHVDANPKADITWEYNGKPVPSFAEIENTFDGACRLRIPNFTSEHKGAYKCIAQNIHGIADTIANLDVEVDKPEETKDEKGTPPRFNPGLEDKQLDAGQPLNLSCRIEAHPMPKNVVWNRDGLPLADSDRVKIDFNPETGECTLSIPDTTDKDKGTYR